MRLIDIRDGDELGIIVSVKRLRSRSGTSSAASDKADLNGIGHGLSGDDGGKSGYQRGAECAGGRF